MTHAYHFRCKMWGERWRMVIGHWSLVIGHWSLVISGCMVA
jgi:hypothetical protein